jgi:chemotaxis receptor (MCP) glutamine deamidase CheD
MGLVGGKRAMNDERMFSLECRGKKTCYVHINETVVRDESHVIHVDLGSCVSVILCGIDDKGKAWFGVNHLFKSREENSDMALEQIVRLRTSMTDVGVKKICCLGLFGAAYREKSLARNVAQRNVLTVVEALSLYNLNVEIFQTGYSQAIVVLKSDSRESFLIQQKELKNMKSHIIEIPIIQLFR